jgi:hypothetical protein
MYIQLIIPHIYNIFHTYMLHIMNITTEHRYIYCTNCKKQCTEYYSDVKYNDKICYCCLIAAYDNKFPVGKGVYKSCDLCRTPNINWYYENQYEDEQNDCGNHDDSDSDDDEVWTFFD